MSIFTRDESELRLRKPEDTPEVWRHVDALTEPGNDASPADRLHYAILKLLRTYSRVSTPFDSATPHAYRKHALAFLLQMIPADWQRFTDAQLAVYGALRGVWIDDRNRVEAKVDAVVKAKDLDDKQRQQLLVNAMGVGTTLRTVEQILGPAHQEAERLLGLNGDPGAELEVPDDAMQQRLTELADACVREHGRSWRHLSDDEREKCGWVRNLLRQHGRLTAAQLGDKLHEQYEWGGKAKGRRDSPRRGRRSSTLSRSPSARGRTASTCSANRCSACPRACSRGHSVGIEKRALSPVWRPNSGL